MIVGYARTSTVEQIAGFESQLTGVKKSGLRKSVSRASLVGG
jgi:DNA invertase Pin-like site-specific DNA recombinase